MARNSFGGDLAAWTFTIDEETNAAELLGGAEVTFWNQQTGGAQYTDLSTTADGSSPATLIVSADGTGADPIGQIPRFWGPDGVYEMWADCNGGPRSLIFANNLATSVQTAVTNAAAAVADLSTHSGALNPHNTKLSDLSDANVAGVTDGQLLKWDSASAKWVPVTIAGLSGTVLITGNQTIGGTKTFQTSTTGDVRVVVQAFGSQTADLFQAWASSTHGQGGVSVKTFYLDARGQVRVLPASSSQVAMQIQARSGQSVNLFEQLDSAGATVAWKDQLGRWRAPNLGHTFAFSVGGNVAVGAGAHRIYNDTGQDLLIRAVRASLGTAPAGASVTVDVNINGTTIYTTQGNRPSIGAGSNTSGRNTSMNVTNFPNGQYLTCDIDAVGSSTPGADLVVQVLAY